MATRELTPDEATIFRAGELQIASAPKVGILYRFGVFELSPATQELRKHGIRVHLPSQACQALLIALESQGECITRDALRKALWPDQQCGDFDLRLNKVVNRIRQALGDSAGTPRYLETLPKVGYRFLAPVQKIQPPPPTVPVSQENVVSRRIEPKTIEPRMVNAVRSPLLIALLVAVTATLLVIAAPLVSHSQPLLEPAPITRNVGTESDPSFSPAGDELAFSWNGSRQENFNIYALTRDKGTIRRLTNASQRDFSPSWSPDGRNIAFLREVSADQVDLMLIAAKGGEERRLTRLSRSPMVPAIDWTRDSLWIVVPDLIAGGQSSLFLISAKNGRRRQITSPPPNSKGDFFPAVSRDGTRLAFTRFINSQWNDIFILSLGRGGDERPIRLSNFAMRIRGLTWAGGDELIFSGGSWDNEGFLYRVRSVPGASAVDLGNVKIEGLLPVFSSAADTLAYARRTRSINIWGLDVALEGKRVRTPTRLMVSSAADRQADFAPDGKHIVFSSNRSGKHSLWIAKADGSDQSRMDFVKQDDATAPRWSPDGRLIAFESGSGHQRNIYLADVSLGTTRKLTTGAGENYLPSWSRDGRALYFCSAVSGSPQIWKISREGGRPAMVTQHGGYFAIESADGADLYFTAGESGSVLHKQSILTGAEQELLHGITTITATTPGFAVAPQGIYYLTTGSDGQTGIDLFDFSSQSSRQLASLDKPPANGLSVSPDGKRILFALRESEVSELMALRNLPGAGVLSRLAEWIRGK